MAPCIAWGHRYWKRMLGFGRTKTLAGGEATTLKIPLLWSDVAMHGAEVPLVLSCAVQLGLTVSESLIHGKYICTRMSECLFHGWCMFGGAWNACTQCARLGEGRTTAILL